MTRFRLLMSESNMDYPQFIRYSYLLNMSSNFQIVPVCHLLNKIFVLGAISGIMM